MSGIRVEGLIKHYGEVVAVNGIDLTVASGEFVINRRDYGLTYQSFLNPIGNEVRVAFTVRAHAS